jgi:hypothetical protein
VLDAVGFHFGEGEDFFHFLKILCEFAWESLHSPLQVFKSWETDCEPLLCELLVVLKEGLDLLDFWFEVVGFFKNLLVVVVDLWVQLFECLLFFGLDEDLFGCFPGVGGVVGGFQE